MIQHKLKLSRIKCACLLDTFPVAPFLKKVKKKTTAAFVRVALDLLVSDIGPPLEVRSARSRGCWQRPKRLDVGRYLAGLPRRPTWPGAGHP